MLILDDRDRAKTRKRSQHSQRQGGKGGGDVCGGGGGGGGKKSNNREEMSVPVEMSSAVCWEIALSQNERKTLQGRMI